MIKSKIKLLCKLLVVILSIYNIFSLYIFNKNYTFNSLNNINQGTIYKINKYNNYEILYIKGNENIKGYIYVKSNLNMGDIISFKYTLKDINIPKMFNTFNYNIYLKGLNIRKNVKINNYKKIGFNKKYFFNKLIEKKIVNKKSKGYIYNFLFADKSYLDYDIKNSYINNGISHLFAVSGFHIILLLNFLKNILYRIFKRSNFVSMLLMLFSIIYLFMTNFSLPLYRAILLYFFGYYNKKYQLNINKYIYFLLITNICLFGNTNYVYLSSFWYVFIIYLFLINIFNSDAKKNTFKVSIYIFVITAPLSLYFNYHINLLSIILNILFSSLVGYIFYPLSFLSVIFNFFDGLYSSILKIFEFINLKFLYVKILNFYIPKFSLLSLILIYVFIFLYIKYKKKILIIILIIFLLFIKNKYRFDNSLYIYFVDVGQGDMTLIKNSKHNILIDTGGLENNNYLSSQITSFLYSINTFKIDTLILSHGDFDHMGEAINLVNNFNVEKVIFNCGPYNDLEKELIKVLNKKKIKYYSCVKELNVDNNKIYFLQTKEYDNENDNSNVIYTKLNSYKFMFMGDAGVEKEKDILKKHNISDIDVLKVGHHGSKTSSGKNFINEINPKYSIISVGKNNRYGHPNKDVLNNLENSKIYRTDQDGSIMFKITNNKLKIETCSP